MGDKYDFSDDLNYKWLDFKIEESNKHIEFSMPNVVFSADLTPDNIKGAAEIHPDKMGRYMVGSKIPIVHEDEVRKDADYFVIIGFGFRDIFIEKEKEFLESGGKLIFCTPKFEIVEHG